YFSGAAAARCAPRIPDRATAALPSRYRCAPALSFSAAASCPCGPCGKLAPQPSRCQKAVKCKDGQLAPSGVKVKLIPPISVASPLCFSSAVLWGTRFALFEDSPSRYNSVACSVPRRSGVNFSATIRHACDVTIVDLTGHLTSFVNGALRQALA